MPGFDAQGWSEIIKTIFGGLKDLILAFAAVGTIWIQAQNSGKLDTAASKAETAALKTEEVKKALAVTTLDRDKRFDVMHADVAAVKAELTKAPEDMDTAKRAQQRVRDYDNPGALEK
jgi:hypothetical protein